MSNAKLRKIGVIGIVAGGAWLLIKNDILKVSAEGVYLGTGKG